MTRPNRPRSSPRVLAALLLFAAWPGAWMSLAHAADFELPALNTPPSAEHHAGKMVWADLVTPDLAAAEKFYGGLFGWTFQRIRAGSSDYDVTLLDGRPIGGMVGASSVMRGPWKPSLSARAASSFRVMSALRKRNGEVSTTLSTGACFCGCS